MEAIITKPENPKIHRMVQTEQVVTVEWVPGNGTRYEVVFTRVGPEAAKVIGVGGTGGWVVSVMDIGRCIMATPIRIPDTMGFLSLGYLMEKSNLSEGDAIAILDLITDRLPSIKVA